MIANQYAYNGDGQRVEIVDSEGTKNQVGDEENILLETDGTDDARAPTTVNTGCRQEICSMFRRLTVWLFVLFILAQHLPQTDAQPSRPVRVWLDDKDDAEGNDGTQSKGTWIDLTDHPVSAEAIARISTLKGVTDLDIGYFPDVVRTDGKALSSIGDIKGLRGLSFFITGVKEKDWSFLAKLSKLEYLHVDGEQLDLGDEFLQFVSRLKRLKTLRIAPESDFSDEGIAKLASLQNLTELRLSSSLMTDRSLTTISELKKLRILSLWSPRLTDDAAEHLANLREFQNIAIGSFHRTNVENKPAKQGVEKE
jgi:hypothetical protein